NKGRNAGCASARSFVQKKLQVELFLVVAPDSTLIDRPCRNVVSMLGSFHPQPSLLYLVGMEIVSFSRKQNCSADKSRDYFLPRLRANQRHPRDVVGVFVQEAQFFPARCEIDAVHLGYVGKHSQRTLLALGDSELELWFECL